MNESNLFPYKVMYGHAYVPDQKLRKVFSPEDALKNGTFQVNQWKL